MLSLTLRASIPTLLLTLAAAQQQQAIAVDPVEIDALFADVAKDNAPGCAVAVFRAGEVMFAKGYGLAQIENRVPIAPTTVFDIGSTSKQFTAAVVLLLQKDGKLALDDDIRKHVPELPDLGHVVTIRHLLHHTGGVRDYINLMMLGGFRMPDHTDTADALAMVARQQALDFIPGTEHSYSNSGYLLLSVIAERVAGKKFSALAAERLFEPLGMANTRFLDDHQLVIAKRASSYEPREDGSFAFQFSGWEQVGDGAVQTTVLDLAKWDANFYDPKVGGPELLQGLQRQGRLNDGTVLEYAAGLMVSSHRGLPVVAHGGAWLGFRAEMVRFPAERLTVAVLANRADFNPSGRAMQVAELLLADRLQPAATNTATSLAAGTPPPDAAVLEGLWWCESLGEVRRTAVREGRLWYVRPSGEDSELLVDGAGQLRLQTSAGAPAVTIAGAMGSRSLTVDWRGISRDVRRFQEVAPPLQGEALGRGLAGRYRSTELDTEVALAEVGGTWQVQPPRGEAAPLEPVFRDGFRGLGLVRLQRNERGEVTGFVVDVGRARNVRFVRVPG